MAMGSGCARADSHADGYRDTTEPRQEVLHSSYLRAELQRSLTSFCCVGGTLVALRIRNILPRFHRIGPRPMGSAGRPRLLGQFGWRRFLEAGCSSRYPRRTTCCPEETRPAAYRWRRGSGNSAMPVERTTPHSIAARRWHVQPRHIYGASHRELLMPCAAWSAVTRTTQGDSRLSQQGSVPLRSR